MGQLCNDPVSDAGCLPVPSWQNSALDKAVMGFSGAICAMLGALVVLRHFDRHELLS